MPKNTGSHELENQQSVPSYLILGPHAKVPKIHFEEVKLGKSKKQTLIIRNPTESPVNVSLVSIRIRSVNNILFVTVTVFFV